jgi:putative spermidine/putrescine transport system substrate-binding protein
MRRAVFEPFERLSGIRIDDTEGFSPAQIKSQVEAGAVQWDAVSMEYSNALQLDGDGTYLEPLDYGVIVTDGFAPNQVHPSALGGLIVGTVIAYRTDAFGGKVPSGYRDFWNTGVFPGPRNWMSGAIGIAPFLEGALLADGVPMAALYPLDVPRALRSLGRIRDDIIKFWESGAQSAQLMADDETVLGVAWNGRVTPLAGAGLPVGIQWNEAMFQTDCWVVPKGAANRANAMKLIAFASMPEPQARLSSLLDYGFTNMRAADYLSADRLVQLPSHYLDGGFWFDSQWWGANKAAVTEEFVEWSLG